MANTGITKANASAKTTKTRPSSTPQGIGSEEITNLLNDQLIPFKEAIKKENETYFNSELSEYKNKNIEVLAVFVGLFTFISVDIQVFKSDITTLSAMGFSIIMLGALLLFIIVLVFIFEEKHSPILYILTGVSTILIALGVWSVGYDHKYTKQNFYTKEEINKMLEQKNDQFQVEAKVTQNEFTIFKNCLRSGGWNACFK